jgi:glycosyltransferase involved in cell wall biosynthesis
MPEHTSHRVTIGMPVFNGELYLERAIHSILGQSYADFRLLIVDNASTDRTGEIACDYASRDSRVVYRRNEFNVGAAPNFNLAFELCDTPYFKWAAHDDELRPTYLEKCVRALDADSTAILAHSHVQEIDGAGNALRTYEDVPDVVQSRHRLERFTGRLLYRGWCTEIFGLMRANALCGTPLIASFPGSDLSLIVELTLRGRFIIISEPLFLHRIHASRYTNALFEKTKDGAGRSEIMAWYDTSKPANARQMHSWVFFSECFPMIARNVSGPWARIQYYLAALKWLGLRNNGFDLAKDVLLTISPRLLDRVMRLRHRREARILQIGLPSGVIGGNSIESCSTSSTGVGRSSGAPNSGR